MKISTNGKTGDLVVELIKGKKEEQKLEKNRYWKLTLKGEDYRKLVAKALNEGERLKVRKILIKGKFNQQIVDNIVHAIILASYQFTEFKKPDKRSVKEVAIGGKYSIKKAKTIAEAQNYARWLAELPSNIATPDYLAKKLKNDLKGVKVKVYDEKELKKMNMGGILAVGKGSSNPPRLVELEYKGAKKPKVCLVGKGVTFDTGGISLKPSKGMHEMKYDKCGAIYLAAAIKAAAELKLPIHIIGVLPFAENSPDGNAQKPGDIIKIRNGKTVEVLNTDAEGRLLLADALSYASEKKADYIIDFATLTGAMVVALGKYASGLFSNDKKLEKMLLTSGEETGERLWPMPLWREYGEMMKSDFADLKNISESWEAGSITAAAFLKEFVKGKWAHIDIAGTAWMMSGYPNYLAKGATGIGVATIVNFLDKLTS